MLVKEWKSGRRWKACSSITPSASRLAPFCIGWKSLAAAVCVLKTFTTPTFIRTALYGYSVSRITGLDVFPLAIPCLLSRYYVAVPHFERGGCARDSRRFNAIQRPRRSELMSQHVRLDAARGRTEDDKRMPRDRVASSTRAALQARIRYVRRERPRALHRFRQSDQEGVPEVIMTGATTAIWHSMRKRKSL